MITEYGVLIGGAFLDTAALGLGAAGVLPSLCSVTASATGREDASTPTLTITAEGASARETKAASCLVGPDWTAFLPAFRTVPVAAVVRLS